MADTKLTDAERRDMAEVASMWWLALVTGVMWVLFGFVVLSFDFRTVWAVAVFTGFGLIVGGAMELATSRVVTSWKWLHVLFGLISIAAGIMAFVWPGQTFLVLAAIIGWYVLIAGILDVIISFMIKGEDDLWWLTLVTGVLQIGVGFWAVGYAGRSIALLVVWVGATAVMRGVSGIFLAVSLHQAGKQLKKLQPAV
jgi:uncharacterized membrane protein HdeD (DUF308 family)